MPLPGLEHTARSLQPFVRRAQSSGSWRPRLLGLSGPRSVPGLHVNVLLSGQGNWSSPGPALCCVGHRGLQAPLSPVACSASPCSGPCNQGKTRAVSRRLSHGPAPGGARVLHMGLSLLRWLWIMQVRGDKGKHFCLSSTLNLSHKILGSVKVSKFQANFGNVHHQCEAILCLGPSQPP